MLHSTLLIVVIDRNSGLDSLERHGMEGRSGQGLVRLGEPLLILVESIRKSLHLALAALRPAQCFNIDQSPLVTHLGSQDRSIAATHGLPSNARVPGLVPPDRGKKKKSNGGDRAPAKCIELPCATQISLLVRSSLYA